MEDKRSNEAETLTQENLENVSGGSADNYTGGYCPYTTDRNCRDAVVKSFDPNNERCRDCGWRAW